MVAAQNDLMLVMAEDAALELARYGHGAAPIFFWSCSFAQNSGSTTVRRRDCS
jgi:hypothetical protein